MWFRLPTDLLCCGRVSVWFWVTDQTFELDPDGLIYGRSRFSLRSAARKTALLSQVLAGITIVGIVGKATSPVIACSCSEGYLSDPLNIQQGNDWLPTLVGLRPAGNDSRKPVVHFGFASDRCTFETRHCAPR